MAVGIVVAFHSVTGTTRQLAMAVAQGLESAGADPTVVEIAGRDIVEGRYRNQRTMEMLDRADGMVLGAPTFMGGPSAQFKAFADASSDRWEQQCWRDKLAAGFTVGSSLNGDLTSTLQYFATFAAQHGMLWVGLDLTSDDAQGRNRLGVQLGAAACTASGQLGASDLATAEHLGARVGRLAATRHA